MCPATFTGIENGTYTDAITGDTQTIGSSTLTTKACSGSANMRVYVLSTPLTPAPGKVGDDGVYLYDTTPAADNQSGYDGNEELLDTTTVKETSDGSVQDITEPEIPIEPEMTEGEQAVFFENDADGKTYLKYSYTPVRHLTNPMIIFNSNGQQTADLILYPGGIYTRDGYQGLSGFAAPTIDGNDTGIRYYNLQGIPVERPVSGLYIRRQGSKAEVIVK